MERDSAFIDAKKALANAIMLAHPSPDESIAITIDASDYAVGAVHEQWVYGAWLPLAFFSRLGYAPVNVSTALLTVSYLHLTLPFKTSVHCCRADSLQLLSTTSL